MGRMQCRRFDAHVEAMIAGAVAIERCARLQPLSGLLCVQSGGFESCKIGHAIDWEDATCSCYLDLVVVVVFNHVSVASSW